MRGKLAFSTLGCPEWDFERVVREAARMGFAAIELRGIGPQLDTDLLPCFLQENRDATRSLLADAGIVICGVGTSVLFHDPARQAQALAEGKCAIDISGAMGIPAIRIFGDVFPARDGQETVMERVASGISALCAYAEANGSVRVLLEVHGEFNTVETLRPLIEKLRHHPSFGLIWDIEHSFRAYGKDYQPFYQVIRPLIRHVHVKDCRIDRQGLHALLPGEGEINIADIISTLERDGYAGYYSFEWEKRWHSDIPEPETAFPHYVAYMNTILKSQG